jgi:hypothetical protein
MAQVLNFFRTNTATNTKTDTPLYNMGINVNDQLYLKTNNEGDLLTDPNPPAILIDNVLLHNFQGMQQW